MELIGLVESPGHVCCRYRLRAFRPWLDRSGHVLHLRSLPRGWWGRFDLLRSLAGATVVLQRHLLPVWQLRLLRRRVARLIFDFDDAVFLRDSYSARGLHHPRRLRRFRATVRACDGVVAGNAFLAAEAGRWTEPGRVRVIPTCVEPACYPPAAHSASRLRGEAVRLVWIGSSSTLRGLERQAPLLEGLGRALPGLRLRLVCDRFLKLQLLPVEERLWSEAGEAAELAGADVGISWVPDDLWSRGKCGLKVLQYMAAGLPVVANPVGVHREMVRHGETGLLASTPGEWTRAVARLAADPGLRRTLGAAGRRLVEERYSVAAGGRLWQEVLDGLGRGARAERRAG